VPKIYTSLFFSAVIDEEKLDNKGNTKGGCITVLLTSCLTGLDYFENKNKNCQLSYS